MATNFSDEDRRSAASRVSTGANAVIRGPQGTRDMEARWQVLKQRAARAMISDTDISLQLAFFASNSARGAAIEASQLLGDMILAAEGRHLPQTDVPNDATSSLSKSADMLALSTTGIGAPSDILLAKINQECDAYARNYLLPNIKTGQRVQSKGEEAVAAFELSKTKVRNIWGTVYSATRALRGLRLLPVSQIRPEALKQPTTSLQTTSGMVFPKNQARIYALQLLASVASVQAMSRPVDEFVRLEILEGESSPTTGLSVEEESESGGFIDQIGLRDTQGNVVDPRPLGIRSGDKVVWLSTSAAVAAVSKSSVTFTDSDIPTGTKTELRIEPRGAGPFKTMRLGIKARLGSLPTSRELGTKLVSLDGDTAAATRNLVQFLADTAALLHPLATEPLLTLERLGAEEPTVATSLSEILLGYDPRVSATTREAAASLLDDVKNDGFDLAERHLLSARLADFFSATSQTATVTGVMDIGLAEFARTVDPQAAPNVRGRLCLLPYKMTLSSNGPISWC